MATKDEKSTQAPASAPAVPTPEQLREKEAASLGLKWPFNQHYAFAKTGANDHGSFVKGDKARGAYSPELVKAYLDVGILVEA